MDSPNIWSSSELATRYAKELDIDIVPFLRNDKITLTRNPQTGVMMFDGCIPGDGRFYEQLSKRSYYYMADKWEFRESIDQLADEPKDSRILEIGCGSGAFLDACRDASFTNVQGVEFNEKAIRECREKGHSVRNIDLASLAEAGEQFDHIFAFQVLEHVPDPDVFMKTAATLLSPGGTLVFTTPNRESFLQRFQWQLLDLPPHHMSRWDKQSYETLTSHMGLELRDVRFEPLAKYHYRFYTSSMVQHLPERSIRRRLAKVACRIGFAMYPMKQSIQGHTIMAIITPPSPTIASQTRRAA
ncbi:Ubiquinone biosynthesis O-methyltransferase [Rubripirellula tenax]|uniref:Ubiquinone biosynthesis O-methyltransferase n=1 Tax=Rubripirellula tenax TaxID=2528015 RepID=A0A5C6FF73_9BACT|nr:class I SAM-dependent methyltransferase [Rubripirellula tenax]TWU58854.1 Ubiquinone biosynthesis O-methyltransferase [Rubripirellula tenax]